MRARIVDGLLDRAWSHFTLYESGRSSLMVLRVALEVNARELSAFDEALAGAMAEIAARVGEVDARSGTAWREVYAIKRALGELRDRRHRLDAAPPEAEPAPSPEAAVAEVLSRGAARTLPDGPDADAAEAEVDALEG